MKKKAEFKSLIECHFLPVSDPRHTEVLGYRVSTKHGKLLWEQLDWSNWWIDGPEAHLFNHGGCHYFHVITKPEREGEVYRVRCWYAGGKYRGKEVESVGIGFRDGELHWIVRTKP